MATYEATIQSHHEPNAVFDYLVEFANAAEWDPGIVTGEKQSLGQTGLGSSFKLTSKFLGRKIQLTYHVVAFERPRQFIVESNGGSFISKDTITVEPNPDGSTVVYHATLVFTGPGRFLNLIWKMVFNRIGSKATTGLEYWLNQPRLGHSQPDSKKNKSTDS